MAMADSRASLDDQFSCPKCTRTLNSPKLLVCGHSICFECLQSTIQDYQGVNGVKCPKCLHLSNVPDCSKPEHEWAKQFTTNDHLVGIMEAVDKLQLGKVLVCGHCSDPSQQKPASDFCDTCQAHYCSECAKKHSAETSGKHKLTPVFPNKYATTQWSPGQALSTESGSQAASPVSVLQKASIVMKKEAKSSKVNAAAFCTNGDFIIVDADNKKLHRYSGSQFKYLKTLHDKIPCTGQSLATAQFIGGIYAAPAVSANDIIVPSNDYWITTDDCDIVVHRHQGERVKCSKTTMAERCYGICLLDGTERCYVAVTCRMEGFPAMVKVLGRDFRQEKIISLGNGSLKMEQPYCIAYHQDKSSLFVSDLNSDCVKCVSMNGNLNWEREFKDEGTQGLSIINDFLALALEKKNQVILLNADNGDRLCSIISEVDGIQAPRVLSVNNQADRLLVCDGTNILRIFGIVFQAPTKKMVKGKKSEKSKRSSTKREGECTVQ